MIIPAAYNVSVTDSNTLALGASDVEGTYAITLTAGSITNSGALDIEGNATFTVAGGQSIQLNHASNDFASAVTFVSGGTIADIEIVDTSAFIVKPITITGDLKVTGAGITDSGNIDVTGSGKTATFNAGSGNDITLDNDNKFLSLIIPAANLSLIDI